MDEIISLVDMVHALPSPQGHHMQREYVQQAWTDSER